MGHIISVSQNEGGKKNMTGELLTELLQSMALLSVFLLIGMFLRAKVKVFQKTFFTCFCNRWISITYIGTYSLKYNTYS